MRICITEHARERLEERGVAYSDIHRRVEDAGQGEGGIERRMRAALVGQEPPVIVEFRPPARATVVTVLDRKAGVAGRVVKLPY